MYVPPTRKKKEKETFLEIFLHSYFTSIFFPHNESLGCM